MNSMHVMYRIHLTYGQAMHHKRLTLLRPQKLLRLTWLFEPLTLFGCFTTQYSFMLAGKEIPPSFEDRISPTDRVDSCIANTLGVSFSINGLP